MMKTFKKGYICKIETNHYKTDNYNCCELHWNDLDQIKRLNLFLSTYVANGDQQSFEWHGRKYQCFGGRDYNADPKLMQEIWENHDLICFDKEAENFLVNYIMLNEDEYSWYRLRVFTKMIVYHVPEDISFAEVEL